MYKLQVRTSKEKRRLKAGYDRYKDNGHTYVLSMMGYEFFNTIEPENIKTLLAVNFKDYNLGARSIAFAPLLGQGIFTTGSSCDDLIGLHETNSCIDGPQWEHSRV